MSSLFPSPFRRETLTRSNSFLLSRNTAANMASTKEKGSFDEHDDDDHFTVDIESVDGPDYVHPRRSPTSHFPSIFSNNHNSNNSNSSGISSTAESSLYTADDHHTLTPFGASSAGSSSAGGSSMVSSTFNLSKTIMGAGFLSLPYGIASFADNSLAVIPSLLLLIFIGWIAIYSFKSIGRACEMHHAKSFAEVWSRVVDKKTSRLLPLIIVVKTLLGCLAFSIVISDSLVGICGRFECPTVFMDRSVVVVVVTTMVLFPLACMRKLDALKYSSAIGLIATVYCVVFILVRYLDHSYQEGGRYFSRMDSTLQPSFSSSSAQTVGSETNNYILINPNVFVLLSMMTTAFVAHFNAPKFWSDLQDATRPRFEALVNHSFSLAIIVYIIAMVTGFLTFGGHCSGNILNNYSNRDNLATIARIGLTCGLIASYPLSFTALRDNLCELLQIDDDAKENTYFYPMTLLLFFCISVCAMRLHNVGKVTAFSGALIGSLLIYIIPATINLCIISRKRGDTTLTAILFEQKVGWFEKLELVGNVGMMAMGVMVAVLGLLVNAQ